MKLEQLDFETLHQKIYDLSQRQLAGDHSCDGLLSRLLDEADRRGDADDAECDLTEDGSEFSAVFG